MDALPPTWIIACVMAGAAVLSHGRIERFQVATAVAAVCGAFPCLLVLDLSGGTRTDFVPFTLFALLLMSGLISAAVGLPFLLWRRQRGDPPAPPLDWSGHRSAWAFLGGVTAVALALVVTLIVREPGPVPLLAVGAVTAAAGVVALCLGLLLHFIFSAALALAGQARTLPRWHSFLFGTGLALAVVALRVLSHALVPPQWDQGVHRLSFALTANGVLLVSALSGLWYARRHRPRVPQGPVNAAP